MIDRDFDNDDDESIFDEPDYVFKEKHEIEQEEFEKYDASFVQQIHQVVDTLPSAWSIYCPNCQYEHNLPLHYDAAL